MGQTIKTQTNQFFPELCGLNVSFDAKDDAKHRNWKLNSVQLCRSSLKLATFPSLQTWFPFMVSKQHTRVSKLDGSTHTQGSYWLQCCAAGGRGALSSIWPATFPAELNRKLLELLMSPWEPTWDQEPRAAIQPNRKQASVPRTPINASGCSTRLIKDIIWCALSWELGC